MILAIDIGNTNIVFGISHNGEWIDHRRIQTDPKKTADEYEVIFRALISSRKIDNLKITGVIFSSVVPSLIRPFTEMLPALLGEITITVLGPDIYDRLPIKVMNPFQIGTDIVANTVAATQKYGTPVTIIDFGTALTFTTVGKDSVVKGVAIAPGLQTAVAALAGKTAQLPHVHLTPPPSVLGENTTHAIQSGIIFGYTGLVNTIIERTEQVLGEKLTIVATGGLNSLIVPLTDKAVNVEPMLTLDGLIHIFKISNGLSD